MRAAVLLALAIVLGIIAAGVRVTVLSVATLAARDAQMKPALQSCGIQPHVVAVQR